MMEDKPSTNDADSGLPSALIIVMGVSSCGKSTIGQLLSQSLHIPFYDGDDLHPQSNIDKMANGIPLTDEDREPWLALIRRTADRICEREEHEHHPDDPPPELKGVVIACSALKRHYRDILRGEKPQSHQPPPKEDLPTDLPALTHEVEGSDQAGPAPSTSTEEEKKELSRPAQKSLRTFFVYIKGSPELLEERMKARKNHFMKVGMLRSQLQTLESPEGEEGVVVVGLGETPEQQVKDAVEGLKRQGFHEQHSRTD